MRWLRCVLLLLLLGGGQPVAAESVAAWRFVFISDTHLGFQKSNKALEEFTGELAGERDRFAFVMHTGDVTELGGEEAFQLYRQAMASWGLPVRNAIGNHDVRWSEAGKERYRQFLGAPFYSFDHGGVHCVVLDTTMVHQTHGHVEKRQLQWLANDLKKVAPATPIFIFSHHPIRWTGVSVDNGHEVLRLLDPFPTKLFFHGHSHNVRVLSWNGSAFVQNGALFNGDYLVVVVGGKSVRVEARKLGASRESREVATIPLDTQPAGKLAILAPSEGGSLRKLLPVAVSPGKLPFVELRAILGGGAPVTQPLAREEKGVWSGLLNLEGVEGGWQLLRVVGTTGGNTTDRQEWDQWIYFRHEVGEPELVWKKESGEIYASPRVGRSTVVAASMTGRVTAWARETGQLRWETGLPGGIYASPFLVDEERHRAVYVATESGRLYRLALATGKVEWESALGAPVYGGVSGFGDVLYIGTGSGDLVAVAMETGKILWRAPLGGLIQATPRATAASVFVGGWNNRFSAVDRETGTIRWQQTIGKALYYSPAAASPFVEGGMVIIPAKDNQVHAFQAESGTPVWSVPLQAGYSSPAARDGVLYLATQSGKVLALDAKTGKLHWEMAVGAPFYQSSPVAHNDVVLVTSMDGHLFALDRRDGSVRWKYAVSRGYVIGTPVADGNLIWVGSMDGSLYCLKW